MKKIYRKSLALGGGDLILRSASLLLFFFHATKAILKVHICLIYKTNLWLWKWEKQRLTINGLSYLKMTEQGSFSSHFDDFSHANAGLHCAGVYKIQKPARTQQSLCTLLRNGNVVLWETFHERFQR